jgi:hypothetical protein
MKIGFLGQETWGLVLPRIFSRQGMRSRFGIAPRRRLSRSSRSARHAGRDAAAGSGGPRCGDHHARRRCSAALGGVWRGRIDRRPRGECPAHLHEHHCSGNRRTLQTGACISHGQRFVSAPVFGRPEAAAAAKLFILAAGEEADLQDGRPAIFSAVSQRVFILGTNTARVRESRQAVRQFRDPRCRRSHGRGNDAGGEGRSAARAVARSVDGKLVRRSGVSKLRCHVGAGQKFQARGISPRRSDSRTCALPAQAADTLRVPMPLLSILRDHLLQTIAVEGEDIDWSGIGRTIAKNAGM